MTTTDVKLAHLALSECVSFELFDHLILYLCNLYVRESAINIHEADVAIFKII